MKEKKLYPIVERWLKRHYKCFAAGNDKGLRGGGGRVDVVGFRDIGGDLSGEVESIAVEVKTDKTPFATASRQTVGYRVYANRVYLAVSREKAFSPDEIAVAGHLGIGLIQVRKGRCVEILTSPYHVPIKRLNLLLMESLKLAHCQICDCVFPLGDPNKGGRWARENVSRKLMKAAESGRGYKFWNYEVGERKGKAVGRRDGITYERRFICGDCVYSLFRHCTRCER